MKTTLHDVEQGEAFRIDAVEDTEVRAQLHRMGFLDGEVECRQHLDAGPVIISRRGTDLAVGAPIARDVAITVPDR
ncbi:Fe2+ transport system protein A [Halanaeroarchaeum sp. HSR-CO]|uniref:FeoA family protein n=1 Tax=Halanaeroarchaeum sp. HSR-CO TaxID=2866382 RepID=UPI00217CD1AC|nr:FeoA family protein [Halanaeroarchaeum sp. HSR-CO]UWG47391.1 Fe2+ transport system protein A [Halanaeroarchaeum sp. HSR-CO]